MSQEIITSSGKMKAIRERVDAAPALDAAVEQSRHDTEQDGAEHALLTQRLQAQFGHDQVTHALTGEDTSPMGTLIMAEWALGMTGLESLVSDSASANGVFSTLQSDEWMETRSAVLSRHETSSQPGHAQLAGELIRRSRGQRLPKDIAARLSAVLGVDISDAVIHTDSAAAQAASAVNAHAFATGQDIFFAQGKYQPGTRAGDELLAHELAHVIQAAEGRIPTASGTGLTVSSPSDSHEREAERVASDAMDGLYGGSVDTMVDADVGPESMLHGEGAATEASQAEVGSGTLHRSADESATETSENTADALEQIEQLARQIRDVIVAQEGDDDAVYSVLSELKGDAYKAAELRTVYERLYGTALDDDLGGDVSGTDLERAHEFGEQEKKRP